MGSIDWNLPYRKGTGQDTSRVRKPGSAGLAPDPASSSGTDNGELRHGLERVDEMITAGRRAGFVVAADNLQNWRDGKGDRRLPAAVFQDQPFFLEHLRERHRPRFIEGARHRLWSHALVPGKDVAMDWTDCVNAPYMTDLYFALGGFTVHSHVVVGLVALPQPNRYVLKFYAWQTDISDTYDWDPGKSTMIPGFGRVTDDEMNALARAGFGRSFRITSEPARITDPEITGDANLP